MLVFLIYGKLCCGGGGFRRPASWSASIGASKDFHAILFFAKGFCAVRVGQLSPLYPSPMYPDLMVVHAFHTYYSE